jgi:hypothetical protein
MIPKGDFFNCLTLHEFDRRKKIHGIYDYLFVFLPSSKNPSVVEKLYILSIILRRRKFLYNKCFYSFYKNEKN